MSAFMVDEAHIDYLVTAAQDLSRRDHDGAFRWYHAGEMHELDDETRVGRMLIQENLDSVLARYSDCTPEDVPGPIPPPSPETYVWKRSRLEVTAIQVLKAVNCFNYQACEHEMWTISDAYAFCETLKAVAVHQLPGYTEAKWCIEGSHR
jgi:hypothetical protein